MLIAQKRKYVHTKDFTKQMPIPERYLERIAQNFGRNMVYIFIIQHPSLCFYSSASPCPLPIKSLSSAWKASKISGHLLLRNSQVSHISICVPQLQSGAWKAEDTVLPCESDIKSNKICGSQHHNMLGLGYTTTFKVTKIYSKDTKNIQKTTGDIYQTIPEQLMTPILYPKLPNCRVMVSGQDD